MPAMPLSLRVFEPRYLQMLQDILPDQTAEFGVVLIERGQEVGGGEKRFDVGTVAQVAGSRSPMAISRCSVRAPGASPWSTGSLRIHIRALQCASCPHWSGMTTCQSVETRPRPWSAARWHGPASSRTWPGRLLSSSATTRSMLCGSWRRSRRSAPSTSWGCCAVRPHGICSMRSSSRRRTPARSSTRAVTGLRPAGTMTVMGDARRTAGLVICAVLVLGACGNGAGTASQDDYYDVLYDDDATAAEIIEVGGCALRRGPVDGRLAVVVVRDPRRRGRRDGEGRLAPARPRR
ncbi:LON peptidase substrate-binding domain-containing protein [Aeromicrobium sp. UC242_57]